MFAGSGSPTSGMTVARLAQVAAGIARGAAAKVRRLVAPKASAYCDPCSDLPAHDKTALGSTAATDSALDPEHRPVRFQSVLGWAWVVFLLLVIGFATVESERVLAELDSLKVLAAYSTGVRRIVRPDRVVPAADAQPRQSPSATRVP